MCSSDLPPVPLGKPLLAGSSGLGAMSQELVNSTFEGVDHTWNTTPDNIRTALSQKLMERSGAAKTEVCKQLRMTINKKFRQDHPSAWMVSRVKTQVLTEIPKEPDTPSFSEILRQKSPAKLPPTRQPPSSWSPSQEEDEPTFGSDWNSFPSFDDSRDSSTRSRFTEPSRSSRELSSSRMPQRDLLISPNAHSLRDVQPLAPSLDRFSQIYGGNGSQNSFFNLDFNLRPPETPQATLEEIRDKLAQLQRTLPGPVKSGFQDSRVRSDRAQALSLFSSSTRKWVSSNLREKVESLADSLLDD